MNKVKCLIVDDEPLARQLLQGHAQQMDMLEVVGECSNAIKAAETLRSTEVDLLFLDIKMPQITGIDFLKMLRHPPAVIFTTAYREYALEGFELDVVDYLLKPVTFDRFFKAIEKYHLRNVARDPSSKVLAPQEQAFVYIKTGSKFHKLDTGDITYIESVKDYVLIHRKGGEKLSAKYRISELEEDLKGKQFLRIHRSFIVNIKNITAFTQQDIEIGSMELPIGNSYKEYVFKILQQ